MQYVAKMDWIINWIVFSSLHFFFVNTMIDSGTSRHLNGPSIKRQWSQCYYTTNKNKRIISSSCWLIINYFYDIIVNGHDHENIFQYKNFKRRNRWNVIFTLCTDEKRKKATCRSTKIIEKNHKKHSIRRNQINIWNLIRNRKYL